MGRPGRPQRIFSEEEIQTIVTMAQTGMGCNRISRILHINTNNVNSIMKQYGLNQSAGRPRKNKSGNE